MGKTENEFAMTTKKNEEVQLGVGGEMAASRVISEVQGRMVIAKKFPRDEHLAMEKIEKACMRVSLAECAIYSYPKGGTSVTGPSIRLAEAIAQCWGNIDTGIVELEQRKGESVMMAFAWDLETNARDSKIFNVRHWRDTKQGGYAIDDAREIYELSANMGSRRKRACILSVIPGDVVDKALEICNDTLANAQKNVPLPKLIEKMLDGFAKHNVTKAMIEARLGHKAEATTRDEIVKMTSVFISLRDGFGKVEDYFEVKGTGMGAAGSEAAKKATQEKATELKEKMGIKNAMDKAEVKHDVKGAKTEETDEKKEQSFQEYLESKIEETGAPVTIDQIVKFLRAKKGMGVTKDLNAFAKDKPVFVESVVADVEKFFQTVLDATE